MSNPNDNFDTEEISILKFLKMELGDLIGSLERMKTGESNEVYSVSELNKRKYILKIKHNDWEDFFTENELKDRARACGVPIPNTIKVGKYDFGKGQEQQFEIQEFLAYPNVDEYKDGLIYKDTNFQEKFLREVGILMKRLHSVTFPEFGAKREGVVTKSFLDYKDQRLATWNTYNCVMNGTLNVGIDHATIKPKLMKKYEEIQNPIAVLCHMDIEPAHIFLNEEKIMGLIDFGNYRISTFHEDFAWWSFWQSRLPIDQICIGYGIKDIENFKNTIIPFRLEIGVMLADYFSQFKNESGLNHCIQMITQDFDLL